MFVAFPKRRLPGVQSRDRALFRRAQILPFRVAWAGCFHLCRRGCFGAELSLVRGSDPVTPAIPSDDVRGICSTIATELTVRQNSYFRRLAGSVDVRSLKPPAQIFGAFPSIAERIAPHEVHPAEMIAEPEKLDKMAESTLPIPIELPTRLGLPLTGQPVDSKGRPETPTQVTIPEQARSQRERSARPAAKPASAEEMLERPNSFPNSSGRSGQKADAADSRTQSELPQSIAYEFRTAVERPTLEHEFIEPGVRTIRQPRTPGTTERRAASSSGLVMSDANRSEAATPGPRREEGRPQNGPRTAAQTASAAKVHIGSLEIRITPPLPETPTRTPQPMRRTAAESPRPLSREFATHGMAQAY